MRVNDEKQIVSYGMSRTAAEKVIGEGEKVGKNRFSYNDGIRIMYRDEKVVGIGIGEDSKNVYITNKELKIGMLRDEIKEKYGNQNFGENESNLDYAYDSVNGKFLNKDEWLKNDYDGTKVYLISAMFDDNGYAYSIILTDKQMATILQ